MSTSTNNLVPAVTSTTPLVPPSNSEYATIIADVSTLTDGLVVPDGFTVVAQSLVTQQADGFAAVAFRDPSGNIIIANEPTEPTVLTTYGRATLLADGQIEAGETPAALNDAAAFAATVQQVTGSTNIYVTGHSLGATEAEEECKALGSECAGGFTIGATGLPDNTQIGNANLIDYVDYADPVGNYASDLSSPLSTIVPDNMLHYIVSRQEYSLRCNAVIPDAQELSGEVIPTGPPRKVTRRQHEQR